MNILLKRINGESHTTIGLIFIDGKFECFCLEDEKRLIKVKGETRVPAGTYIVEKRKVETPMTKKYRDKYEFFDYHLWIKDIPDFEFVYIHIGNDDKDTDGCILVGDLLKNNRFDEVNNLLSSRVAFKRLYEKIGQAMLNETIHITISDEDEIV